MSHEPPLFLRLRGAHASIHATVSCCPALLNETPSRQDQQDGSRNPSRRRRRRRRRAQGQEPRCRRPGGPAGAGRRPWSDGRPQQAVPGAAHLPHLLRGRGGTLRRRAGGAVRGSPLRAAWLPHLPLHLGHPGGARHRRALHRHAGQRRLRPLGRPRLRALLGLPHGHLEVRVGRHQRRRLPRALRRLPRARRAGRRGGRAPRRHHRVFQRCALVPQLHGPHRRGMDCRRARPRLALAFPTHVRHRAAQDPPAPLGRRRRGEGLEALLQHPVLEPQLLGQRQHHGRRGGAARQDAPQGASVRRVHDVVRVPAAAHGCHRRHRRAAGELGERILRRRRRHDRGPVAQVLDRGGRGAVLHRPLLGDAEQRSVPAAGHGRPGPPPARLRRARSGLQHPLGQHRGHQRHHPGHVILQLQQHRGRRQLPLQPRHAPRVRRLHLAPHQEPGPVAPVPRADAPARRRCAVPRALGVPRLRHGHRRVEGVRHQRGLHRCRGRGVLPHAVLQGQGVPQVQRRRRGDGVPSPGQQKWPCLTIFCLSPDMLLASCMFVSGYWANA